MHLVLRYIKSRVFHSEKVEHLAVHNHAVCVSYVMMPACFPSSTNRFVIVCKTLRRAGSN